MATTDRRPCRVGSLHVLKMADDHDDELDNYSDNEGEVGDSSLLDPQISDDVLLDHEDLGDDPNKKEEISNLEEEEAELEAIKAKVKEMEEEQKKLQEMQGEMDKELQSPVQSGSKTPGGSGNNFLSPEEKQEIDSRSVYVGNVDYSSTAEEVGKHFEGCGPVNRVTIMCDKWSGHPKGFAYIEFVDKDSVEHAIKLNESLFKGRQLKVIAKRTNKPGLAGGRGSSRGRGRGRGYGRGGFMYPFPMMIPFFGRGRGRSSRRGRGAYNYTPY